jgi:hypothetical protein
MARAKMTMASLPTCFSWKEIPVHSYPIETGSLASAMSSINLSAWPELNPGAAWPVIEAVG